jgi:hypothetical protein
MLGERYELRDLWGSDVIYFAALPWQTLQQLSLHRDGERTVKDRQSSQTLDRDRIRRTTLDAT